MSSNPDLDYVNNSDDKSLHAPQNFGGFIEDGAEGSSHFQQHRESFYILLHLFANRNEWNSHGNLKVICGGFLIIAPVRLWWWMSEVFVIITCIAFIHAFFSFHWAMLLPALTIAIFELMAFYKTCLKDPGIQVRPQFIQALQNALTAAEKWRNRQHVSNIITLPNGVSENHLYCWKCHHYRSTSTSHCGICNCCMKHDHHCPVFGGCVAKNNLSSFKIMVFTMSCFWLYTLAFCAYKATSSAESLVRFNVMSPEETKEFAFAKRTLLLICCEIVAVILVPTVVNICCHCCRREPKPTSIDVRSPSQRSELIAFVRKHLSSENEQQLLNIMQTNKGIASTELELPPVIVQDYVNHNQYLSSTV